MNSTEKLILGLISVMAVGVFVLVGVVVVVVLVASPATASPTTLPTVAPPQWTVSPMGPDPDVYDRPNLGPNNNPSPAPCPNCPQ